MVLPFRHLFALSKLRHLALCLGTLTVTVLYAPVAAAIPELPGEIRDILGLDCTPSCLLCHKVEAGGEGTLNGYGESVKGVQGPGGAERVYGFPDGTGFKTDYDKDLEFDANELIDNTDPRTTAKTGICSDATYGCGAQVAPGGTPFVSGWGLVAALGVAVALARQLRA